MTTTTPAPDRPLLVQAAHKWYSWAGVAVTVVGASTATGQLRFGMRHPGRAAGPGVSWKPAVPITEAPKFNGQAAPDDPFKAATPPRLRRTRRSCPPRPLRLLRPPAHFAG